MTIPSFDDFKLTITEEKLMEMLPFFGHHEIIECTDGITPENLGAVYSRILDIAINKSLEFQLALLAEYHEWLRTQIES